MSVETLDIPIKRVSRLVQFSDQLSAQNIEDLVKLRIGDYIFFGIGFTSKGKAESLYFAKVEKDSEMKKIFSHKGEKHDKIVYGQVTFFTNQQIFSIGFHREIGIDEQADRTTLLEFFGHVDPMLMKKSDSISITIARDFRYRYYPKDQKIFTVII